MTKFSIKTVILLSTFAWFDLLSSSRAFQQQSTLFLTSTRTRSQNSYFAKSSVPILEKEVYHHIDNNAWDTQFRLLIDFQKEYGHTNVPQHPDPSVRKKYPQLASFCKNQRSQYKNLKSKDPKQLSFLTASRIQRLESIGFQWNFRQAAWENKYDELVQFFSKHGHSNVPPDCRDLHGWISYQRLKYKSNNNSSSSSNGGNQQYKPLTSRQIELLEDLNFRWSPKDEVWWNNYAELKEYKKQKGNFRTSVPRLRQWKNSLRRSCREYVLAVMIEGSTDGGHVSGLNPERLDALREINFCWLPEKTGGPLLEEPPEDIFAGYQ